MSPSHRNPDTTKDEEYDYDDEEFKNVILPKKEKVTSVHQRNITFKMSRYWEVLSI